MGRLFWKAFLAFWLALLLAGIGVGVSVSLYGEYRSTMDRGLAVGPRAAALVDEVARRLAFAGPERVRYFLRREAGSARFQVFVVDAEGRDIADRPVPPTTLLRARALLDEDPHTPFVRQVLGPDGVMVVFAVAERLPPRHAFMSPGGGPPPSLAWPLLALGLASLGFSALLAWYLARPLRLLRGGFDALASGDLDARVAERMGRRRDEVADLGRDFDNMASRLQRLVSAQRRLLHDVSHELRSPLARLQVAIGLARQNPDNLEHSLQRIEREAGRLDVLVGELLTLSRLEAGQEEGPGDEPVNLLELLSSVVEDAGFEAAGKGCQVVLHGQGDCWVRGRAELLHRAVENIVRNAVKYTAPDSRVDVTLSRPEPGVCVLRVDDHGPGVPDGELDAIFTPFHRSEQSGGVPGYGLGLAIARRAIARHGGRVHAENRAGGGLCIVIQLPCQNHAG